MNEGRVRVEREVFHLECELEEERIRSKELESLRERLESEERNVSILQEESHYQ